MADTTTKKYLDYTGLEQYDAKIKALISSEDATTLQLAKDYCDSKDDQFDAAGSATTALSQANAYTDGKIETVTTAVEAAQSTADNAVAAAANAKSAADAAQADVDALETYVGTIPEGATATSVVAYIDEKTSGIATDAALDALTARVTAAESEIDTLQDEMDAVEATAAANASAIATLNGSGTGSVKKQIDDAFNEFATNISDDGVVNTYKELVDYCATHSAEAAEMAGDIAANAIAIAELESFIGTLPEGTLATTVIDYINQKIATEQSRAESAEAGLDTRLDDVEAKLGTGAGSVTEQIAAAKSEAISTAASDATAKANQAKTDAVTESNSYTDTQIATVQSSVNANTASIAAIESDIDALQANSHTHDNKTVLDSITAQLVSNWNTAYTNSHTHSNKSTLDGITDALVANWNASEANAKSYADELVAQFVPVTSTEVDSLFA